MAQQVKTSDLVQKDVFKDPRKSAEALISTLDTLQGELKETAKDLSAIANSTNNKSSESVNKLVTSYNQVNKAQEQNNKIITEKEKLEKRLAKAQSDEGKELEKLKAKISQINKESRDSIKVKKEDVVVLTQKEKLEKQLAQTLSEEGKQLAKLREEINAANKANKTSVKVLTEKEKLEKRLTKAQSQEGKELASLRVKINEVNKANRESAKQVLIEADAYKELSDARNKAQREFKRLSAEIGEDSEEAQKALQVFEGLNKRFESINKSAKDGRPFVGRYADAIQEAGINASKVDRIINDLVDEQKELNKQLIRTEKEFGENSKEAIQLRKRLSSLDDTLEDISKSSKKTEKSVEGLSKAFKAFASATIVLKAIELVGDLFTSSDSGASGLQKTLSRLSITVSVVIGRLVDGFSSFRNSFLSTFNDLKINYFEFLDSLNTAPITIGGVEIFSGQVVDVSDKLNFLRKRQEELSKTNTDFSKTFQGVTEEINLKIAASDKAIDQNLRFIRSNSLLQKSSSELGKEISILESIFDNDSKTLIERAAAIDIAIEKQKEQSRINIQITKNDEELSKLRAKSSTDSAQAQADLQNAISARIEAETQGVQELNSLIREKDSIERDSRDLRLDFFIDEVESRIAQNDKIIENEETTLEKQSELILKNNRLRETSFKAQTEVLNNELESQGKSIIDFNDLLSKSNEEITETVISAFGETAAIRVLEVIKTRREGIIELTEAQKELSESNKSLVLGEEEVEAQNKAIQSIIDSSKDYEEAVEDLEKDLNNIRKKALETEIARLEDGNLKKIELQKELNDILLDEQSKAFEKQQEQEQKSQEESQEIRNAFIDALGDGISRQSEQRIEDLDTELSQIQKRSDQLRALAANGNKEAGDSLVEADKRASEIALKRQKEQAKQQKIEAGIAALKLVAEKGSVKDALSDAAGIGLVVDAALGAIGSFYDGTDDTGHGATGLSDKHGNIRGVVHEGEKVLTAKENTELKKHGVNTREDILNLARGMNQPDLKIISKPYQSNKELIKKFDSLIQEVKQIPNKMPDKGLDFDKLDEHIVNVIKYQNRTERVKYVSKRTLR